MNYLEYFGLKEDPFKITPDPSYFFESLTHRKAKELLKYTVASKEGFCVILGEPGTGKTTVLKKFLKEISKDYIVATIYNPMLNPEEFLKTLLDEFKIDYRKESSKNELLKYLYTFLEEKLNEGKRVLIVIDEAQLMPFETLEELRLLSNLETEKEKLVQIILVGQPELEEKLQNPKLRQLQSRISNKMFLEPLSKEETEKYLNHRLKVANFQKLNFDKSAIEEIYKHSSGIPRIINLIASRSLMVAFLENTLTIKDTQVQKSLSAIKTSENLNFKDDKKFLILYLILIVMLSSATVLVILYILRILKIF
ncbi:AAA family ATPase [Sulfurihydrogenibium sp.]|uniref:ExeA family protein n=1 Tax=Sulfurihydrogenibium sp. TaxID=2053621 RepID=UPI0026393FD8|nr:AAA family ATPase [Sulfurihydrogenibium sp.]